MGGRGSTGAGLGLNAPLRFDVLMENCGRAGPTAVTVAAGEAETRPDQGERKRERKREGRTNNPEGAGLTHTQAIFCIGISHTEEEGKKCMRNQTKTCKIQRKHFRLLSVPLRITSKF